MMYFIGDLDGVTGGRVRPLEAYVRDLVGAAGGRMKCYWRHF